jgi:uncharacterized protein
MLSTLLLLSLCNAPTPQPRVITMSGDARITFRPNQVVASFLISATGREPAGAKKSNDEKLAKFLRACREAGVEQRNITITELGVVPEYRGNEVVSHALNRSATLTITDMARVDDALTAAVRNGGTPNGSVTLQNTEHSIYETKVRVAAATSARERAKGVTEALGAKLGLPTGVTDRTPPVESVAAGGYSVPPEGPVVTSFATRELVAISQVSVQFDVETP